MNSLIHVWVIFTLLSVQSGQCGCSTWNLTTLQTNLFRHSAILYKNAEFWGTLIWMTINSVPTGGRGCCHCKDTEMEWRCLCECFNFHTSDSFDQDLDCSLSCRFWGWSRESLGHDTSFFLKPIAAIYLKHKIQIFKQISMMNMNCIVWKKCLFNCMPDRYARKLRHKWSMRYWKLHSRINKNIDWIWVNVSGCVSCDFVIELFLGTGGPVICLFSSSEAWFWLWNWHFRSFKRGGRGAAGLSRGLFGLLRGTAANKWWKYSKMAVLGEILGWRQLLCWSMV